MNEDIMAMLKYLRLGGLLENWDRYIKLAQKSNMSNVKLLEHIIKEEHKIKKENSRRLRTGRAKIHEKYTIETFPFSRQPKLNRGKVMSLYDSFDYISKNQNIIWIGPTGVGKTGLATAFLMHAIDHEKKDDLFRFLNLWRRFINL